MSYSFWEILMIVNIVMVVVTWIVLIILAYERQPIHRLSSQIHQEIFNTDLEQEGVSRCPKQTLSLIEKRQNEKKDSVKSNSIQQFLEDENQNQQDLEAHIPIVMNQNEEIKKNEEEHENHQKNQTQINESHKSLDQWQQQSKSWNYQIQQKSKTNIDVCQSAQSLSNGQEFESYTHENFTQDSNRSENNLEQIDTNQQKRIKQKVNNDSYELLFQTFHEQNPKTQNQVSHQILFTSGDLEQKIKVEKIKEHPKNAQSFLDSLKQFSKVQIKKQQSTRTLIENEIDQSNQNLQRWMVNQDRNSKQESNSTNNNVEKSMKETTIIQLESMVQTVIGQIENDNEIDQNSHDNNDEEFSKYNESRLLKESQIFTDNSKSERQQTELTPLIGAKQQETEIGTSTKHSEQSEQPLAKYMVKQFQHPRYSHMIMKENEIFYGAFQNSDDFLCWQGYGWHYKVVYDRNWNPSYSIYEGNFFLNQREGFGTLYGGKSLNINYQGEWKGNKQYQIDSSFQISSEYTLIQSDNQANQNQINKTWIKFNQQINQNDIALLESKTSWFTSSIIDAFSLFLNVKDEQYFFSLKEEAQQQYQRVLLIPSHVFTSMHIDQNETNKQIYQRQILEFLPIDFQLQKIYKKVCFIINHNKHWYLIQLDLTKDVISIVDSLPSFLPSLEKYDNSLKVINDLFDNRFSINHKQIEQQQYNGYDCGPWTCINMLHQLAFEIEPQIQTPIQMRKYLLNLIQYES